MLLEYFYLFMKQLGFNSGQIALTTLFGVQHLLIPLCLLFGEKYRARNAVAILGTLAQTVSCVLPLIVFVIPTLQPVCHDISDVKPKEVSTLGHVSVNSKNANNSNNVSPSMIHKSKYDLAPTKTVSIIATSTTDISMFSESSYPKNVVQGFPLPKIKDTSLYVRYKSAKSIQHQFVKNSLTVVISPKSTAKLALNYSVSLRQNILSNGSVRSRYLSHSKQSLASNQFQNVKPYETTNSSLSKQQSISMTKSLHSNRSRTDNSNLIHPLPILGALFALLTLSRAASEFCLHLNLSLVNLATITYLKEKRASYGGYYMWGHIGNAFSIACVAFLAWWTRIDICGIQKYGYFIAFIWAGVLMTLSIPSLHWFKFEYDEKKSFNWSSVKSDVLNVHYILMFLIVFFTGVCVAFQLSWEFWYLDGLSASPLLIAGAVLIRRPLLAISMYTSSHLIRKIGDLNTVCVGLFYFYSVSFFALSFTRTAWLVLIIDAFQAAAYGLTYCAFVVVFHKASSKENSSMILGKY